MRGRLALWRGPFLFVSLASYGLSGDRLGPAPIFLPAGQPRIRITKITAYMKSQKINLQGIVVVLRKIECNPGENKIRSTILFNEAIFSVTITGTELISGEVPPTLLPALKDHITVYFSPMAARGRKNSYNANH